MITTTMDGAKTETRQQRWYRANKERVFDAVRRFREKHPERVLEYAKKSYWKNKEKRKRQVRASVLKTKYGISVAQFEQMLAKYEQGCWICKRQVKLCVDHCHSSGKTRGLLCGNCNSAIGMLRDSQDLLERAKAYLRGEL